VDCRVQCLGRYEDVLGDIRQAKRSNDYAVLYIYNRCLPAENGCSEVHCYTLPDSLRLEGRIPGRLAVLDA